MLAASWCSMAQPPVIIIIIIQPRVSRASSASSAAEEGLPQHGVLRYILYSQLTVAMGSPPQVAWRLLSLPPLVEEADHLIIHKQSALDSPLLPHGPPAVLLLHGLVHLVQQLVGLSLENRKKDFFFF